MKKIKFSFLIVATVTLWQFQGYSQSPAKKDNPIVFGHIDTIRSEVLKENRALWIFVPQSAVASKNKIPVVYLLDGDAHYYSVAGMIHQLSEVNGNTVCPEMIVVGIPNTDRTRDLTPTHLDQMFGDSTFVKTSGGHGNFMDFLEKEVIPYIAANYPASSYRTYIGHSLGGLAVVHTLLTRPHLFSNYVAIDPSLWWDDNLVLGMADSLIGKPSLNGKSLYLAIANTLPEGMTFEQAKTDTSEMVGHIRANAAFANLAGEKGSGLHFAWKFYDDDDHGSVPLIAEYDAMRFLFPWFHFDYKMLNKFMEPGSTSKPDEMVEIIRNHFNEVSGHFGYQVLPGETLINTLGYSFMMNRAKELSFLCFNLNIENYPESSNVYDSMGDHYLAFGDPAKAKENFTKSLELKETAPTRKKLMALTGE
jgi:uncharacterized protein